ncbi:MAG: hypothetical protein AB7F20_05555 [Geoalkalibacter sp.]
MSGGPFCATTIGHPQSRFDSLEENLTELTRQAEEFATKQLPILKALQIA